MNEICRKYCELMMNKYSNEISSIIIYGSNIYNSSSSDLDVCLIVNKNSTFLQKKIVQDTLKFHKQNKLHLDEEIPHSNKLIYTFEEINEALTNHPFYKNNEIFIDDIVKCKKFLSSKTMKKRLILNILTTDHLTIGKSTEQYEKRAFKLMMNIIIKYYNLSIESSEEILQCFYQNRYTGAEGEMYLGYKKNFKQKDDYLRAKIKDYKND